MIVTKEAAKTIIKYRLLSPCSRHFNNIISIAEGIISEKEIIDLNQKDLDDANFNQRPS